MDTENKDFLSRLTKLETQVHERTEHQREALKLAREILDRDIKNAADATMAHFEQQNQWQRRWDRREEILATKEDVNKAVRSLLAIILSVVTLLGLLITFGKG